MKKYIILDIMKLKEVSIITEINEKGGGKIIAII